MNIAMTTQPIYEECSIASYCSVKYFYIFEYRCSQKYTAEIVNHLFLIFHLFIIGIPFFHHRYIITFSLYQCGKIFYFLYQNTSPLELTTKLGAFLSKTG